MLWLKPLQGESDESSWALPYGDLMSLLLAVFVMIAAMSELRQGRRFCVVRSAVRSAFGFCSSEGDWLSGYSSGERRLSLLERLEGAGLGPGAGVPAAVDEAFWEPCEVFTVGDGLLIRIAGSASFEAASARLKPSAEGLIARLAQYLAGGEARVEIRGHSGDGRLPEAAPFRDGLDLSYARARAVADALTRAGVPAERLYISAWGDGDPLVLGVSEVAGAGVNRRIEMIVHSVPGAGQVHKIAEKERVGDG